MRRWDASGRVGTGRASSRGTGRGGGATGGSLWGRLSGGVRCAGSCATSTAPSTTSGALGPPALPSPARPRPLSARGAGRYSGAALISEAGLEPVERRVAVEEEAGDVAFCEALDAEQETLMAEEARFGETLRQIEDELTANEAAIARHITERVEARVLVELHHGLESDTPAPETPPPPPTPEAEAEEEGSDGLDDEEKASVLRKLEEKAVQRVEWREVKPRANWMGAVPGFGQYMGPVSREETADFRRQVAAVAESKAQLAALQASVQPGLPSEEGQQVQALSGTAGSLAGPESRTPGRHGETAREALVDEVKDIIGMLYVGRQQETNGSKGSRSVPQATESDSGKDAGEAGEAGGGKGGVGGIQMVLTSPQGGVGVFREQQRRACLTLLSLLGGESSGSIDALALWSPPAPRGSRAEREEEEARKLAVAHTLQRCSGVKALVHVLRCAYTDVSVEAAIALRPARERRAALLAIEEGAQDLREVAAECLWRACALDARNVVAVRLRLSAAVTEGDGVHALAGPQPPPFTKRGARPYIASLLPASAPRRAQQHHGALRRRVARCRAGWLREGPRRRPRAVRARAGRALRRGARRGAGEGRVCEGPGGGGRRRGPAGVFGARVPVHEAHPGDPQDGGGGGREPPARVGDGQARDGAGADAVGGSGAAEAARGARRPRDALSALARVRAARARSPAARQQHGSRGAGGGQRRGVRARVPGRGAGGNSTRAGEQ